MARLVAAVGTRGNNIVSYAFQAARHSQHGVSGAYVLEIDDKRAVHEDNILPFNERDITYTAFRNLKGSIVTGFLTKNIAAKERSIGRGFLLDGYLTNPQSLLTHENLDYKESDPYIAQKKIVSRYFERHDLDSINNNLNENIRGVGIFKVNEFEGKEIHGKSGLIIHRSKDGWRTIWVGRHPENLQVAVQENYIFSQLGISEWRELEPGETLYISDGGERSGRIERGVLEFDPQQISHDFHNDTVVFGRSINEIRGELAKNKARGCRDYIPRKPGQEIVVVSFRDVTRTGAVAFASELDKLIGNVRYEEFYIPERGSSVREQQANFENENEFPFALNASKIFKNFDPVTRTGETEILSILKDCYCIGYDDSLIGATDARKHHETMDSIGIKDHAYVTYREPIIDPRAVGYLTVPKKLFFDKYRGLIESESITTIDQVNLLAKGELGYDIFLNNAEDFAAATFGNSSKGYTKENLAMPAKIRNMPQR